MGRFNLDFFERYTRSRSFDMGCFGSKPPKELSEDGNKTMQEEESGKSRKDLLATGLDSGVIPTSQRVKLSNLPKEEMSWNKRWYKFQKRNPGWRERETLGQMGQNGTKENKEI